MVLPGTDTSPIFEASWSTKRGAWKYFLYLECACSSQLPFDGKSSLITTNNNNTCKVNAEWAGTSRVRVRKMERGRSRELKEPKRQPSRAERGTEFYDRVPSGLWPTHHRLTTWYLSWYHLCFGQSHGPGGPGQGVRGWGWEIFGLST